VFVRGATTATSFVSEITYNARGQRERVVYGNHTETAYTYDPERFWLTRLRTDRSSSSSHGAAKLQDLSFERDLVGNITEIDDNAQETVFFSNAQVSPERAFVYDSLYRLVSATGREKVAQTQSTAFYADYAGGMGGVPDSGDPALRRYTQSYLYDAAGNILETKHQQGTGGSVIWRRGYAIEASNNQLISTSLPGDDPDDPETHSHEYAYNARGAMVFLPHLKSGVSANLVRDFRDQIRKAELDSAGNVAWYTYDASGERVRKVWIKGALREERIYVGGFEVWRQIDDADEVEEERQTLHVMDDEQRIAMIETLTVTDSSAVGTPTPRVRYQLGDHLGTALLEVDGAGGVISYEEYHPYGTTAWWAEGSAIEVSRKRYRYTGKERDEETGLQYHSARYYAPWLGRWCSADPLGIIGGINAHQYTLANPIGLHDPKGLTPSLTPMDTVRFGTDGEPTFPPGTYHDARDEPTIDVLPDSPYQVTELLGEYDTLKAIIRGDRLSEGTTLSPDEISLLKRLRTTDLPPQLREALKAAQKNDHNLVDDDVERTITLVLSTDGRLFAAGVKPGRIPTVTNGRRTHPANISVGGTMELVSDLFHVTPLGVLILHSHPHSAQGKHSYLLSEGDVRTTTLAAQTNQIRVAILALHSGAPEERYGAREFSAVSISGAARLRQPLPALDDHPYRARGILLAVRKLTLRSQDDEPRAVVYVGSTQNRWVSSVFAVP
jgi:RHS repeat-associated protein